MIRLRCRLPIRFVSVICCGTGHEAVGVSCEPVYFLYVIELRYQTFIVEGIKTWHALSC